MLRKFLALFLLTAMMSAQFSRVFVYAGFELNQQYIASTLCENKARPEMQCNGKCYLSKKLKQAEEKEKKQDQEAQKKGFQENFIIEAITLKALPPIIFKKRQIKETDFELPNHIFEILHPPPAVFIS